MALTACSILSAAAQCVKGDCENGFGIFQFENGSRYEGDFLNGEKSGHGVYSWQNGERYQGQFKYNKKHGYGTYTWSNGDIYTGNFENGLKHGKGVFIYVDGSKYDGMYAYGKMDGYGSYTFSSGNIYKGEFKNDMKHGHGTYILKGGETFTGTWVNDQRVGEKNYIGSDAQQKQTASETKSVQYAPQTNAQPVNANSSNAMTYHVVQPKETLYRMTVLYGVTAEEIRKWNNLAGNELFVGQKIIVGNKTSEAISSVAHEIEPEQQNNSLPISNSARKSGEPLYHTVQPKEGLYRISVNYGVAQEDIRRWNNLTSDILSIGQQVIVGYAPSAALNNTSAQDVSTAVTIHAPVEIETENTRQKQYEDALERAEKASVEQNYERAKIWYSAASDFMPELNYPKQKLAETEQAIANRLQASTTENKIEIQGEKVATGMSDVLAAAVEFPAESDITTHGMALPQQNESSEIINQPGVAVAVPLPETAKAEVKVNENPPLAAFDLTETTDLNSIKYRRSSLSTMMIHDMYRTHADTIRYAYMNSTFPEKYNNHNLSARTINGIANAKNQEEKILEYLNTSGVARDLVAKWFNRSEKGTFNMDLVAERGHYNATEMDAALAQKTARGEAMLADAGEELISNTFVLVTDFKYISKEEVTGTTKKVIGFAKFIPGAGAAVSVSTTAANTALTVAGKGYVIKATSYLYRLNWNESIATAFYTNYWMDENAYDPVKKAAFENSSLFTLSYIGSDNDWADVQSSIFTSKSEEELIQWATTKAAEKVLAKLQRKYEVFRTKTPLLSAEPLAAKIGLKEGIDKNDKFEVLEQIQDENGRTYYKKVGIINVDNSRIWDNRFMAAEERQSNNESEIDRTFFVGSGKNFYPGMLIKQIN